MSTTALSPQAETVKTRLKNIWMAGDYDRFSRYMENGAREFYERLNLPPGSQLLDVGCGSGQLALMAAKDGLEVTGVDIAGNLVERARARAEAEGLRARFEEAWEIIRRAWTEEVFSYEGRFWSYRDVAIWPRQRPMPNGGAGWSRAWALEK